MVVIDFGAESAGTDVDSIAGLTYVAGLDARTFASSGLTPSGSYGVILHPHDGGNPVTWYNSDIIFEATDASWPQVMEAELVFETGEADSGIHLWLSSSSDRSTGLWASWMLNGGSPVGQGHEGGGSTSGNEPPTLGQVYKFRHTRVNSSGDWEIHIDDVLYDSGNNSNTRSGTYGWFSIRGDARLLRISFGETLPSGSGPQTLAAPHISSTAVLYAPTLVPGSVTLAAPHISSGAVLYAPTLNPRITLAAPHIASTAPLYAPTLTVGQVNLAPPAISSTAVLYAPTLVPGAVTLAVPHISSGEQLFPPALGGGQTLSLPFIAGTEILYAPSLVPGAVSLAMPAIASTATLYAPTLVPVGPTLALPVIASGLALYPPTLVPGSVSLAVPFISSVEVLYAPRLNLAGVFEPVWFVGDEAVVAAFLGTIEISLAYLGSPDGGGGIQGFAMLGGVGMRRLQVSGPVADSYEAPPPIEAEPEVQVEAPKRLADYLPARIRRAIYAVLGTVSTTEVVLDGFDYGVVPDKPQAAAFAVLTALGFGLAFSQTRDR